MLGAPLVLVIAGGYLALLFVIASAVDRMPTVERERLFTGVTYTLSLAVYCTSWTFFGAVGTAVRSGLEFVTIYIGPTLLLMAWWLLLRKMTRIAKAQRIISIADFLSSRYGKSPSVAMLVTVIAVAAITPYIALQLLAVSKSFQALVGDPGGADVGFWTAALMAFFVIMFGTRRVNADESQPGIVAAIAFESIVKLTALIAVALCAVLAINDGALEGAAAGSVSEALADVGALPRDDGVRWVVLTSLSAAAMICLPRQFQVAILENRSERHIALASWLFPLYLFLIAVVVLPIAAAGLTRLPAGAEPDLFVLTVPMSEGLSGLALFAFIGGLSSATSMVIVASLALAVMISNHLLAPFLIGGKRGGGASGISATVLFARRLAIVAVLALGYLYSKATGGSAGLASIGLIAFAGVAQFAPALIGGLFWRNATRIGATAGLAAGALVWFATLLLPSFGMGETLLSWLRALVLPADLASGPDAVDPLVFGSLLSTGLNAGLYLVVSLATGRSPLDQLQATLFVDALHRGRTEPVLRRSANRRDLFRLTQRILGPVETHRMFREAGLGEDGDSVDSAFVARVEGEIAVAVGAASAHTLVTRVATGEPLTVDAAIALLSQTQDAIRVARELGVRSVELEQTADELRAANATLVKLLEEKDEFLSRVSHEMRTPLTAVRAFADLLQDGELDEARADRFVGIIATEADRLTRLLDDILDLSRLEAGRAPIRRVRLDAAAVLRHAAEAMEGFAERNGVRLRLEVAEPLMVDADWDRLTQVLVNLISNAVKFSDQRQEVVLGATAEDGEAVLRVRDHGCGVSEDVLPQLFTKFAGSTERGNASGAGLGLAIAREIAHGLGGSLALEETGPSGSVFALRLPLVASVRA